MKRGKWWTSLKRYIAIRPQASSPRSLSLSLSFSINPIVRSFVRSFIRSFVRSAIRHQKSQASSRSIHDGGIRSINRNRGGEWPTFEIQCLNKSLSPLLREFEEGKIEGKSLHADDTIFVVISFLQKLIIYLPLKRNILVKRSSIDRHIEDPLASFTIKFSRERKNNSRLAFPRPCKNLFAPLRRWERWRENILNYSWTRISLRRTIDVFIDKSFDKLR